MAKIKEGLIETGLNNILFPVELIDNPNQTNSEYSKIVVGETSNGLMHLNYCSSRYELVSNADIFPNIENVLKLNGIEFTAHYSHINNVRFYANMRITDKRFAHYMNNGKDLIYPQISV